MRSKKTARRFMAALAAGTVVTMALVGCGTSPQDSAGSVSYWYLTGEPGQTVRKATIDRFNEANPDTPIEGTTFANEVYPTKLRTAVGAGQGPTLMWGWGGGGLRQYVENDQVMDLTSFVDENPELRERIFDSAWDAGTIDGKIYAIPGEATNTEQLFYNKEVFKDLGVEPPKTWDDLMALVPIFKDAGIAPLSLAGQSRWTEMMYVEFLVDRIGGPEVFERVLAGDPDAWSDPAVVDALTKIQDLVEAGGFINGFSSIAPDSNADRALLYTGKAAMLLQGSWIYGGIKNDGGDFVTGGNMGYVPFPVVEGGKGDPSATVGNPAQFMSISSKATPEQVETAKKFLLEGWTNDEEAADWVGVGSIPVVKGIDESFAGSDDEEFLNYVYKSASEAKPFIQTWDQALSPAATEILLDNISKIFQLSITPEQFADEMNKAIDK